ncbi:flavodoxin family protein [Pectinatus haikarae]|uniref:Multimeric flavodoxin WrbA n=1 Tax=Pectinatus haikarae TaxID=349096 RepID=A0ABT9Y6A1_9FIRM|nr:flavodoxin family protein [Pectinatus haikarae]MDQ0203361.1 multimeric flavodoxin WrbA [Pectinatus haikarae]
MKVLLINGSPHKEGCTYTALNEVAGQLKAEDIETEILHIGNQPVHGCIACGKCTALKRCIFEDDPANTILAKMKTADGIVIGSPVYYAAPNGALCALLDRIFFSGGEAIAGKPAAAIVSCRRGGASSAFDRLNKYFTINQMPVATSQYWNSVHGFSPADVKKDLEGLQTMRILGHNMSWLLKNTENSFSPLPEERIMTNFID